jgi:hypothetical protein
VSGSNPGWYNGLVITGPMINEEFSAKQDWIPYGAGVSDALQQALDTVGGLATYASSSAQSIEATAVPASTTVSAPGCYVATTSGITITLGSFTIFGLVTIVDGTYVSDPNITIVGTINGSANYTLTNPGESVDLIWFPGPSTWVIK